MTWVKRTFPLSDRHVNSLLHSETIPWNVVRIHLIGIDGTLDRVDFLSLEPRWEDPVLGERFL